MTDKEKLKNIIMEITNTVDTSTDAIQRILFKYPGKDGRIFKKSKVISKYKELRNYGDIKLSKKDERKFLDAIRLKKVRTISGVTPVTVLTKPYPCPGECIYCPNDIRMPKSYLRDEPGAQRAEKNKFDPYLQTYNRLVALNDIGHPTDKVELIILGGTWSVYPEEYQIWFVKRCFDAMNDFNPDELPDSLEVNISFPYNENKILTSEEENNLDEQKFLNINIKNKDISEKVNITAGYNEKVSLILLKNSEETAEWEDLKKAQAINEKSITRCIGLVVETRPDYVTKNELVRIRKLGGTKIQIGIQSLDDKVLRLNNRGHNSATSIKAINLIRQAGFKIHAHWMPNLYGSNVKNDKGDFKKLFTENSIQPDELKIYPCSLIENTYLMDLYKNGDWTPYSEEQLLEVLISSFVNVPRYCRITRVIRDISSNDIVAGNKKTNFRQIVERQLKTDGLKSCDIREREIKDRNFNKNELKIKETVYQTEVSEERFIEFVTPKDYIVGFLRLSFPKKENFVQELKESAVIRELHIYGQSLNIGKNDKSVAQHRGLGKKLLEYAEDISKTAEYKQISVISAIGTKDYYRSRGYIDGDLYQHKQLK